MLIAGWLPGNNSYALDPKDAADPGRRAAARKWWSAYAEAVRIMTKALARNGATLLAGTDAGTPILVPGHSLHQELNALVASGLSPAQALRSATADAGRWLGEPVGRIAPGYRADLVLLEANPLTDIANTARISDVFLSGKLYQRSQLDDMLAQVAAANNSSRSIDLRELHQQLLKQAEMN